jgi:hypothetical protein
MTLTSFVDRIKSRDPLPEREFTWLGVARGYKYGTRKGREYAVDLHGSDPTSFTPDSDEIAVARKHVELIDGSPFETVVRMRGWPVPTGTYAKLAATRKKPDADKPMRAWDRLAALPLMQREEPLRLVTGPAPKLDQLPALTAIPSPGEEQAMAEIIEQASKRPTKLLEIGGNEPPERSVAGIVAYLERQGVELSLQRGRLLARSRAPIRVDLRELIEQTRELLVGHLQGKPVLCSLCSAAAVTIAFPDAPVCAEHAGQ